MRSLTVWQPWASLIMIGAKHHEFRGKSYRLYMNAPQVGERIVIQAGARPVRPKEVEDLLARLDAEANGTAELSGRTCLDVDKARALLLKVRAAHKYRLLPTGMALGTVVLGQPILACDLFRMNVADSDRSNFNWAWPLSDIRHFEPPIEMRGYQGFFNVNVPEVA
ncbi:hypothetical protein ACE10Z_23515 [Bradyrhizobium sp. Pha-3]|uniref:hypothetical protein n=1 Tax=Bradyrhizobium sp. Pha-3 TaxID=208375 RepID=UPI0035D49D77